MNAKLIVKIGLVGFFTFYAVMFGLNSKDDASQMYFNLLAMTMMLSIAGLIALSIFAIDEYIFKTSTTRNLLILFGLLGIPFTLCWVNIIIYLFGLSYSSRYKNEISLCLTVIAVLAFNYFKMLNKLYMRYQERVEEDLQKKNFTERLIDLYNDPTVVIKTNLIEQMQNGQMNYVVGSLIMIEKTIIKDSFTKKVEANIPNVECSICYDGFQVGDFKTDIACHHSFHYKCIIEWGRNSSSCPLCRHSFRLQVLRSLLER
jgi:hypothetical protein